MTKEYRARSFKSGNSVAIRMPAELGIEPGCDWTVVEEDGDLVVKRASDTARKIDLTGIYGSIPGLEPLSARNRLIEGRELDWEGKRIANE